MKRWEAWLLHLSTIILTVTGVVYAVMHYLMKPSDPFSVANHPLEPHMRDIHILAAPVLVVAVGIILHSHILFKLENGSRSARKSGVFLIPLFTIMAASGYLLQIASGSTHKFLFWMHLGSGAIWALAYMTHHIASLKLRRMLANAASSLRTNGSGNGKYSSTTSVVRNLQAPPKEQNSSRFKQ